LQEEAIPHVNSSSFSSAQALLDYDCEEPIDLLVSGVPSDPRDVATGEARPMADVLTFDDHEKSCESCRKASYALRGRGFARLTREMVARRTGNWLALCLEGKRLFVESWSALGLGLPTYAQET
jgi:hypothetical protein